MRGLFPQIEPYAQGMLDVGDGNLVYWETCGNPRGKPALVVHGGPGSGCSAWHRRLFGPGPYRVVLFDQRNCGRSVPHASDPAVDLTCNTTWKLVADMEALRRHLQVDRWLVLGGSWGSTLALAYAKQHPQRVSEMILFGVTTGRHSEFDWLFRGGVAAFFPEQWARLRSYLPGRRSDRDMVEGYHHLLHDPDPGVRQRASIEWCTWESATLAWPPTAGLARRFRDSRYAIAFARLVTHYVRHNAWLEDGCLLNGADSLADIPGVLVNGRFDFQAPIGNAWELSRAWPRAELVVVGDAGHAADAAISEQLVCATDRFTRRPGRAVDVR